MAMANFSDRTISAELRALEVAERKGKFSGILRDGKKISDLFKVADECQCLTTKVINHSDGVLSSNRFARPATGHLTAEVVSNLRKALEAEEK